MNSTTPDFTWLFIKMITGLVLVLGLAVILLRYVLPKTRLAGIGRKKGSWAQFMDRLPMGPKQSLNLVKISGRYFVLGVSENSVNLITELSTTEGEKIENT